MEVLGGIHLRMRYASQIFMQIADPNFKNLRFRNFTGDVGDWTNHVGYVEAYHPNMLDDGRCIWIILICRFQIEAAGGVNEGQHRNLHPVVWVLSAFFLKSKCRSDATLLTRIFVICLGTTHQHGPMYIFSRTIFIIITKIVIRISKFCSRFRVFSISIHLEF